MERGGAEGKGKGRGGSHRAINDSPREWRALHFANPTWRHKDFQFGWRGAVVGGKLPKRLEMRGGTSAGGAVRAGQTTAGGGEDSRDFSRQAHCMMSSSAPHTIIQMPRMAEQTVHWMTPKEPTKK